MDNNVTLLFKAINYVNKKTLIPIIDDYIFIENGTFILQDAYKTYALRLDILKDIGNCVILKSDFISLKQKNSKYFIDSFTHEFLKIKVVTKDSEKMVSLPYLKKNINLYSILEEEFKFSNCIETNGISLKAILSGFKDDISFKFNDNKIMVSMGEKNPNDIESFIYFNDEFGAFCSFTVNRADSITSTIVGENLVEAISQFGLVKKNSIIQINFNENYFLITNSNVSIYISSNRNC